MQQPSLYMEISWFLVPSRVIQGILDRFDTSRASTALQTHTEHVLLIALIASFWLAPTPSTWEWHWEWNGYPIQSGYCRLFDLASHRGSSTSDWTICHHFPVTHWLPLQMMTDVIIIMLLGSSLLLHSRYRHTGTSCVTPVWVMFCFHEHTVASDLTQHTFKLQAKFTTETTTLSKWITFFDQVPTKRLWERWTNGHINKLISPNILLHV